MGIGIADRESHQGIGPGTGTAGLGHDGETLEEFPKQ